MKTAPRSGAVRCASWRWTRRYADATPPSSRALLQPAREPDPTHRRTRLAPAPAANPSKSRCRPALDPPRLRAWTSYIDAVREGLESCHAAVAIWLLPSGRATRTVRRAGHRSATRTAQRGPNLAPAVPRIVIPISCYYKRCYAQKMTGVRRRSLQSDTIRIDTLYRSVTHRQARYAHLKARPLPFWRRTFASCRRRFAPRSPS